MSGQPTTNTLCVAATAAAEAGLFVFPVHPRSKVPAVENWERVATRDPARIRSLWATRPYNLGPTGALASTQRSGLSAAPAPHATPPPAAARKVG
jgi:hypothetical protein